MKKQKTNLRKYFYLMLSLVFLWNLGFSQEDTTVVDFTEMSLEELMGIKVVTASKTAQSASEAPASMMVITDQMIKDRGYHHLEEILHDLPGFDFNKNYGVNYSTIFMRGYRSANSDRFILMFDGIIENDIWKQTTWISRQYPVSQIKQVEILYGPASALYGTNAFSGIINVITKKGDDVGIANVTLGYGSWGRKNVEFSSGKMFGDKFGYNITAKYFAQDDLHQWDDFDAINGDSSNFSQTYLDRIGTKFTFMVDEKYVEESFNEDLPGMDYGIHANLYFGDFKFTALTWQKNELEAYFYNPFKRSGVWTQWYEGYNSYMLSHNFELNDKLTFSTSVTMRSHKVTDSQEGGFKYYTEPLSDPLDPDYAHSQTIVHNDFTTYQLKPREVTLGDGTDTVVTGKVYNYKLGTSDISFEEQVTYVLSEKFNVIGGLKYTLTNTQEDYIYALNWDDLKDADTLRHDKKTIAAYAQAIIKPNEAVSITLGGRFEDQKDENKEGYSIFTPRFSVVFKTPDDIIFRIQYAEAFQEADDWHKFATDFNLRPYGSPELEPEKLKSLEIGTTMKLGGKLLLSGAFYSTVITNFISEVDNTPENPYQGFDYGLHYENSTEGDVKIYGWEISYTSQLMEGFSLNGNFSGVMNVDNNDEEIGDMAPFKMNLGLLYNYENKITFYPKLNYVSSKNTINWKDDPSAEPIFTKIGGYGIFGFNINILNMFGAVEGLNLNLKVDNVLGSKYYNPGSRSADGVKYTARVLQPGTNVMAGLTYNFK